MVGKRFAVGRLLMLFKTWLPQAYIHRFGKEMYDPDLQEYRKGRYRSITQAKTIAGVQASAKEMVVEVAKSILKLRHTNSFKGLSETDRVNMIRNIREVQFIGMVTGVFLALVGMLKDYDDEDKSYLTVLANILNKSQADLTFFLNPKSSLQAFSDMIPVITSLVDILSIVGITVDALQGETDYQSGPWKGTNKFLKWGMRVTPGASGAMKMVNAGYKVYEYN